MASNNGNSSTFISGTVEGVNDRGVKIDGDWYNLSKFGTNDVELPDKDDDVTLRLDNKGYIRAIKVEGATRRGPVKRSSNGRSNGSSRSAPARESSDDRSRSIVLQTVMKTAGAVLNGLGPSTFADTANTILEWYDEQISASTANRKQVDQTEDEDEDLEDLPF